ncbi:MAG: hypothetical protein ACREOW_16595 [Thermodesulfobacteriota bacterium]
MMGKKLLGFMTGSGTVLMFISIILGFTIPPAYSQVLEIDLIPQDDQLRGKGIMILCPSVDPFEDNFSPCTNTTRTLFLVEPDFPVNISADTDFNAKYKVDFRLNGVNADPDEIECLVLHKEVCTNKVRQFITEEDRIRVIEVSDSFNCRFRQDPDQPGVGVIEVYILENVAEPGFIGDNILKVVANVGEVSGSAIQDLCVLGFPACRVSLSKTLSKPGVGGGSTCNKEPAFSFALDMLGERFNKFTDPLFPFASCEDASLFQRKLYELPTPDCPL